MSEIVVGPDKCTPHVRRFTLVKAKAILWLLEIPANNIGEILNLDLHVLLEGIQIIDCNFS